MTVRTRARWLEARPLAVLAGLPLALLAFNDAWIWDSTAFQDNHVYVGFFRHYLEFNYPYVENYKSSRLPFLFPGVLLYRLLPDALAHHVLFLIFLVGEAVLLFFWARRRFGPHAAFFVAASQTVFTFSHIGPSYHNQPASMYFVAALVLLDEPARWPSWVRAMLAGGAFVSAVTTDSIVAALTPVFVFYAFSAVPRSRWALGIARNTLAAIVGAALAVALLGAINAALGGRFLFSLDQVEASMFIAEQKALSRTSVAFLREMWRLPWLTLPSFTGLASVAVLGLRVVRLRFDEAALATFCFLVSIAMAILMHARGLGLLEYPHLFSPFFTPMFLALAAILGAGGAGKGRQSSAGLGVRFLALSSFLLLAPLSLLGATFSRLLDPPQQAVLPIGHGSIIAFSIFVIATATAVWRRRSPTVLSLVVLGAFGLVNAINTPPTQPAYLYDVRSRCSFRRDFFTALLEADPVFTAFDADNHARWTYPPVRSEQPEFDGQGWCSRLPAETVARDILLSHYFFTSVQYTNGFKMPGPLRKLVVSGPGATQVDFMVERFRERNPGDFLYTQSFSTTITRTTFSVLIRGYDISPKPRASTSTK